MSEKYDKVDEELLRRVREAFPRPFIDQLIGPLDSPSPLELRLPSTPIAPGRAWTMLEETELRSSPSRLQLTKMGKAVHFTLPEPESPIDPVLDAKLQARLRELIQEKERELLHGPTIRAGGRYTPDARHEPIFGGYDFDTSVEQRAINRAIYDTYRQSAGAVLGNVGLLYSEYGGGGTDAGAGGDGGGEAGGDPGE